MNIDDLDYTKRFDGQGYPGSAWRESSITLGILEMEIYPRTGPLDGLNRLFQGTNMHMIGLRSLKR